MISNDGNTTITGDLNFTGDIYQDDAVSLVVTPPPVSVPPPTDPGQGDIWFDTDLGNSYIYYNDGDSSQWIEDEPSQVSGLLAPTRSTPSPFRTWALPTTASWVTVR